MALTLQVRLGAVLAAKAGQAIVTVETTSDAWPTAAEVRELVGRLYPPLAEHLPSALVVADGRVLGPDEPVLSSRVALLPPAGGGA